MKYCGLQLPDQEMIRVQGWEIVCPPGCCSIYSCAVGTAKAAVFMVMAWNIERLDPGN